MKLTATLKNKRLAFSVLGLLGAVMLYSFGAAGLYNLGAFWKAHQWITVDEYMPQIPQVTLASGLAVDSNGNVWVVAKAGAVTYVRESSDGGGTWNAKDTNLLPNGSVHIAIDGSNNIYVLYSPSSFGPATLRKSTDGGTTWTNTLTSVNQLVLGFVVDSTGLNMMVVSSNWNVMKSTDGGSTWSTIDSNYQGTLGNGATAGATCPLAVNWSTGVIVVSGYEYNWDWSDLFDVRVSQDGGATWNTTYSVDPSDGTDIGDCVAIDSLGNIYVAGWMGDASYDSFWTVLKSADNGSTWSTVRSLPANSQAYSVTTSGSTVYVGGVNSSWQIEKSADGGTTWSTYDGSAIFQPTLLAAGSGATLYSAGLLATGPGSLLVTKTTDGGATFSTIDTEAFSGQGFSTFNAIYADPHSSTVYAAGPTANHGLVVRKSADEGKTWTIVDQLSSNFNPVGITMDSSGNVYVLGQNSSQIVVRKSSDAGVTWTDLDNYSYPSSALTAGHGIASDASGNLFSAGFAVTTDNVTHWIVQKSTDGGLTWSLPEDFTQPGGDGANAIAVSGLNVFAVGDMVDASNNRHWIVRASYDGGTTWGTADDFLYPSGIADEAFGVNFDSSGNIFVVGGVMVSGTYHWIVRESVDNGVTWSTIDDYQFAAGYTSLAAGVAADGATVYVVGAISDSSGAYWLVRQLQSGSWSNSDLVTAGNPGSATAVSVGPNHNIYVGGNWTVNNIGTWVVRKSQ